MVQMVKSKLQGQDSSQWPPSSRRSHYTETFSATAKMPTVCVVLANAAHQNWEIEHVDIKSAYLNAPLKEEIYMQPPQGVLEPGQEGMVLRLLKGLYGLKQASRGGIWKCQGYLSKE